MKKPKVYSIGNNGRINYYIFEKKNSIVTFLFKEFSKIFESYFDLYEEFKTRDGKMKTRKRNFEKLKDFHLSNMDGNSGVNVFFGEKKIFVTINCTLPKREKFNQKLKDFVMPKSEKKF